MFNKLNYKIVCVLLSVIAIIALATLAAQHVTAVKEEEKQIQIAQQEEKERLQSKEKRDEELRKRMSFKTIFDK